MKKRSSYSIRRFKCPICGTIHTATKSKGRTSIGHEKNLWCFKCKKVVLMTQIDSDSSK